MLFVHRDIADARDLAKKKYFMVILKHEKFVKEINKFMNAAMDAKRIKLNSNFVKHLPITNYGLGHNFLAQMKRHYNLSNRISNESRNNFNILLHRK